MIIGNNHKQLDCRILYSSIISKVTKPTVFKKIVFSFQLKHSHIHESFGIKSFFMKGKKITWKDPDIWKSCYDDLNIFSEKGNILKILITSFEIISLFECTFAVGITFIAWRYWQGLYWINSISFAFSPAFKAYLIITKWYFALSTSCEVTCSTFFLSFPLLFLFSGPV